MTINVEYVEVPAMPDSVRILVMANEDRGICGLTIQATGSITPIATPRTFNCSPTAEWSGIVRRGDIGMGVDVFASLCPDPASNPDLTFRINECREGRGGVTTPQHWPAPPPAVPIMPPSGRRCPPLASGSGCDEDEPCNMARALLAAARRQLRELCRNAREASERATALFLLAVSFFAAALTAGVIAAGLASTGIFAVAAIVVAAIAAALFITALSILVASDVARNLALAFAFASGEARMAFDRAVFHAASDCICPGCGVPSEEGLPPSECEGLTV